MIRRVSILISFCILLFVPSNSQNLAKPVEYRFLNGETGLRYYLTKNCAYPDNSILNNTIGFSLSAITINNFGAIENIKIINPVDQYIDKEVIRVLKSTAGFWQKCDTIFKSQTFYVQIAFTISTSLSDLFVSTPVKSPFFIDPVVLPVTRFSTERSLMTQTNEFLGVKSSILVGCELYNEALPYVNELIRRNPFSKELYQFRIFIFRNLGLTYLVDQDLIKLSNFAEGLSLFDILNKY